MPDKYKWECAWAWLYEKATEWDRDKLFKALTDLAAKSDGDTLQDIFEAEMDEDGFFDPIAPPELIECGSCGCWHRAGYDGDCRDDFERFPNWQCDRCREDAAAVVKTRFGFEPVCLDCKANLKKDGLILEERE